MAQAVDDSSGEDHEGQDHEGQDHEGQDHVKQDHVEQDHTHDQSGSKAPHSHGDARNLDRKKLFIVLALSGSFMVIEFLAGLYTKSLALMADAGHMLGDVAALGLASFAIWLSAKPAGPSRTYGFHRSEILAALANSVILVVISIFVLLEAFQRFSQPPEVQSTTMLIVASLAICINLFSMRLLSQNSSNSLNTRAALMEVASDLLASVGVILAAIVIMISKWYLIDPIVSCVLALFILWRTWGLLKESIDILMESAPDHVNLDEMSNKIMKIEGVVSVHDLHVWTITSGMIAMSGHVKFANSKEPELLLAQVQELLKKDYAISHSTIQLENEVSQIPCPDNCAIQ